MGPNPIAPRRTPTALERARADYLAGRIGVEELERRVESLVRSGREDEPWVPEPGGLPPAARHAAHVHEWGTIEGGRIFCDAPGCRASAPMTDDAALAFVWGAGPAVRVAAS